MFHCKQSVGHVLLGIRKVTLHVGVVPFEESDVAILLISLPRGICDESTPEWPATTSPECRTNVRHFAIVALCICVALQPVAIERIHVVLELRSQDRGIAVATITLSFDVWAIHHIAAKCQATESVVHHIMDGTKVLVAADERRTFLVTRMDKHTCDVREGRLMVQSFYFDVSISVVVELVAERFITLAACNVIVGENAFIEVAA